MPQQQGSTTPRNQKGNQGTQQTDKRPQTTQQGSTPATGRGNTGNSPRK